MPAEGDDALTHRATRLLLAALTVTALAATVGGCSTPAPELGSATSPTAIASTSTAAQPAPSLTGGAGASSSQVTPTASTTGFDIPADAQRQTVDGAVAFTRYFADQANRAYSTLNSEEIQNLISPNCKGCTVLTNSISDWKSKNYHYLGDIIKPTYVTASAFPNDGTAKVFLANSTTGAKLVDAQNSLIRIYPAEQSNAIFNLSFESGSWKVTEIQGAA